MCGATSDWREALAATQGPSGGDLPVPDGRTATRHRKGADYPDPRGAAQPT